MGGAVEAAFEAAFEESGEGSVVALACGIGFFGYIEIMGARACRRARETRIVWTRGDRPRHDHITTKET